MNNIAEHLLPQTEDFSRYEFKYLLRQAQCDEIEDEVRYFMSYDGHVHPEFGNRYLVRSLYFDNATADGYYEKIDGIKTRRKFRIRTYGATPDKNLPIFLEEKGRYNNRTYKHRIPVRLEDLCMLENPDRCMDVLDIYPNVPLIKAFVSSVIRRQLKPVVLVDYLRRPYTSAFDTNFRLTFDSKLSAAKVDVLYPPATVPSYLSQAGWTILEVKFHRRIPAWFHRILQAHSLTRLSVSKYCLGMEICGLVINLS